MSPGERRLRIHLARRDFMDSLARALIKLNPEPEDDDPQEVLDALHDAKALVSLLEEGL